MALRENRKEASAQQTRAALVAAAMHLFGQKGFDATSTRDIAAAAGTNVASIAYHFGSKEGLRHACAARIVATLGELAGASAIAFDPDGDADAALAFLETIITRMVQFLTINPAASDVVAFVLREVSQPGAVMDVIYGQLFEPVHEAICRIWATAAKSDPQGEETRLAVFATLGQALYFRIGQPIVLRRMGWEEITPYKAEKITRIVIANMHRAILEQRERSS